MNNMKNQCNQIIYIGENKIGKIIHTLGQEMRAWSNDFGVPSYTASLTNSSATPPMHGLV